MAGRSRWPMLAGAVLLVLGLGQQPGFAVLAGQFCADADAGVIRLADNGATVQCTLQSFGAQRRWVQIVAPPSGGTGAPAAPATPTGIVGFLPPDAGTAVLATGGQTGIITISPSPSVVVTASPATAVPAMLALTG